MALESLLTLTIATYMKPKSDVYHFSPAYTLPPAFLDPASNPQVH